MGNVKIIFLDMDGVLNSDAYLKTQRACLDQDPIDIGTDEWWIEMVDPEAVARLNRIVRESGAKIVISSSWRDHCDPETMQRILDARGFKGEVIGRTPITPEMPEELREHSLRGLEIEVWLTKNKNLDVETFVILDDMGPGGFAHMAPYLVHTSWIHGLLDPNVEEALTLLAGEKEKQAQTDS